MSKPSLDPEPRRRGRSLRDDGSGATAIEFAFVFPVLVFVSLAIIDFAMVMLNMHRISDALQRAGREAAIRADEMLPPRRHDQISRGSLPTIQLWPLETSACRSGFLPAAAATSCSRTALSKVGAGLS